MTPKQMYKEYCQEYRSIIVDTWEEAEALIDYMKSINHKIDGKLTRRTCKSMGKDCVHVCEAMHIPEGGFKQ